MVTPAVLLAALVVVSPSLWRAGHGELPVDVALVHFLLAVALVAAGRAVLRTIVGAYARAVPPSSSSAHAPAQRRRSDADHDSVTGIS